jgi:hypothetical protein
MRIEIFSLAGAWSTILAGASLRTLEIREIFPLTESPGFGGYPSASCESEWLQHGIEGWATVSL